jgi:NAD(P)-dependent dehydrogenase (short-subunit alcohol dehydrogenase family)
MAQLVAPGMRAAKRGSILNVGSIAWVIPGTDLPVYVTAKAAIVGMTRTLAHEFGPDNVRVNCIMPGAILTERQRQLWFTPDYEAEVLANQALKRMILPHEVASLVLFLAADDSAAITSQSYIVDGDRASALTSDYLVPRASAWKSSLTVRTKWIELGRTCTSPARIFS